MKSKAIFLLHIAIVSILCIQPLEENERFPRFASFKGLQGDFYHRGQYKFKTKVPYTDDYLITPDSSVESFTIKEASTNKILAKYSKNNMDKFTASLKKDTIIELEILKHFWDEPLEYTVEPMNHKKVFPYDPINNIEEKKYIKNQKTQEDPLKPAVLKYTKREGGLYINDNNPEILTDEDLNQATTRKDISNKDVFFSFEHFSEVSDYIYYGYQVINRGSKDIFVTIKNIGLQLGGPGTWKGEKEWILFYNQKFRLLYKDKWTESQRKNFEAHIGFCDTYEPVDFQPITYIIPPNKHIYVLGGTTEDAYLNINVAGTADQKVKGTSNNGAVLFEVVGDNVEGVFYAYHDPKDVQLDNHSHQGYVVTKKDGKMYGATYVGYDNCHGVVDMLASWTFNDNTPSQMLPVTYTNRYKDNVEKKGIPYSKIDSTEHVKVDTKWATHINPQDFNDGVGTDMTFYYTVNSEKKDICIDPDHYDGRGEFSNIGNWMMDYIDTFNFINEGDKDRSVTISITDSRGGAVLCMVRDSRGDVIEGTQQYAVIDPKSEYGDAVNDYFVYKAVVKAHSNLVLHVEYNLLANSYGYLTHDVKLE